MIAELTPMEQLSKAIDETAKMAVQTAETAKKAVKDNSDSFSLKFNYLSKQSLKDFCGEYDIRVNNFVEFAILAAIDDIRNGKKEIRRIGYGGKGKPVGIYEVEE